MQYFTVGPTHEYPRFREFLAGALAADIHSISHRSAQFVDLFHATTASVRSLLRAQSDAQVFFAGSATEWMERCVQNMSTARTLHFVSGTFSKRFYDFALSQGRDARKVEQKADGSFDMSEVPAGFVPEMIALTHNETSNGTQLSPEFFAAVRAAFPESMIALDIVSSAPVYPDVFTEADVLFFSVQKGFGMPAGLGVALVSPRALARAGECAAQQYTGAFHSFGKLAESAAKGHTVETPNVLGIYLLNKIAQDMAAIGVETLRADTHTKAAMVRAALTACAETELEPIDTPFQSQTVIVAKTPGGSKSIIERLKKEGITIASGYGTTKDTHIRIGNFTAHTVADMERLAQLL
jgi:phosphoserine aminotransferase